jgi:hypothetical protein
MIRSWLLAIGHRLLDHLVGAGEVMHSLRRRRRHAFTPNDSRRGVVAMPAPDVDHAYCLKSQDRISNSRRCWESGRVRAGGTSRGPLELVAAQSGHLECQICRRHPATADWARVVQPAATWFDSAVLSWRRSLQLDCWRLPARDKKRLVH